MSGLQRRNGEEPTVAELLGLERYNEANLDPSTGEPTSASSQGSNSAGSTESNGSSSSKKKRRRRKRKGKNNKQNIAAKDIPVLADKETKPAPADVDEEKPLAPPSRPSSPVSVSSTATTVLLENEDKPSHRVLQEGEVFVRYGVKVQALSMEEIKEAVRELIGYSSATGEEFKKVRQCFSIYLSHVCALLRSDAAVPKESARYHAKLIKTAKEILNIIFVDKKVPHDILVLMEHKQKRFMDALIEEGRFELAKFMVDFYCEQIEESIAAGIELTASVLKGSLTRALHLTIKVINDENRQYALPLLQKLLQAPFISDYRVDTSEARYFPQDMKCTTLLHLLLLHKIDFNLLELFRDSILRQGKVSWKELVNYHGLNAATPPVLLAVRGYEGEELTKVLNLLAFGEGIESAVDKEDESASATEKAKPVSNIDYVDAPEFLTGKTALVEAIELQKVEAIEWLLDHGASMEVAFDLLVKFDYPYEEELHKLKFPRGAMLDVISKKVRNWEILDGLSDDYVLVDFKADTKATPEFLDFNSEIFCKWHLVYRVKFLEDYARAQEEKIQTFMNRVAANKSLTRKIAELNNELDLFREPYEAEIERLKAQYNEGLLKLQARYEEKLKEQQAADHEKYRQSDAVAKTLLGNADSAKVKKLQVEVRKLQVEVRKLQDEIASRELKFKEQEQASQNCVNEHEAKYKELETNRARQIKVLQAELQKANDDIEILKKDLSRTVGQKNTIEAKLKESNAALAVAHEEASKNQVPFLEEKIDLLEKQLAQQTARADKAEARSADIQNQMVADKLAQEQMLAKVVAERDKARQQVVGLQASMVAVDSLSNENKRLEQSQRDLKSNQRDMTATIRIQNEEMRQLNAKLQEAEQREMRVMVELERLRSELREFKERDAAQYVAVSSALSVLDGSEATSFTEPLAPADAMVFSSGQLPPWSPLRQSRGFNA